MALSESKIVQLVVAEREEEEIFMQITGLQLRTTIAVRSQIGLGGFYIYVFIAL